MDVVATLKTAYESLVTAFATAAVNPKPNYSIDGQSVSHGEYLKMLIEGIKATLELLGSLDPVELRSVIL